MQQSAAVILLAEDDESLRFVIQDNLELRGFRVEAASNGREALEKFRLKKVDLCILDVMMPEMDGFAVAQKIREQDAHVPVLFLTARGQKEDRLQGFRVGGDDYLTKPFSIEELLFRMEVFLKRPVVQVKKESETSYRTTKLEFFPEHLRIDSLSGSQSLTYKESELLELFFRNSGQVIKREDILMKVWGTDDYYKGRSLDVFISRLRKFLQADEKIEIQTVHGVGFKFLIHSS